MFHLQVHSHISSTAGPSQNQERGTAPSSPTWVAGVNHLVPLFCIPNVLAERRIRLGQLGLELETTWAVYIIGSGFTQWATTLVPIIQPFFSWFISKIFISKTLYLYLNIEKSVITTIKTFVHTLFSTNLFSSCSSILLYEQGL